MRLSDHRLKITLVFISAIFVSLFHIVNAFNSFHEHYLTEIIEMMVYSLNSCRHKSNILIKAWK